MSDTIDLLGMGLFVVIVLFVLAALVIVVGGIAGFVIVTLYNSIVGTGVDPMVGALIGSVVAVCSANVRGGSQ